MSKLTTAKMVEKARRERLNQTATDSAPAADETQMFKKIN